MKLTKEKLKKYILESLDESQYYYDAQDLNTDFASQAIELGQSMGDKDDRDRAAQVDKYVSLKVTKALRDAIEKITVSNIHGLQDEAASHLGLQDGKEFDEYDQRTYEMLGQMYKKALKRPLEALEQFDGTQESFDKWYDALRSVERVLMKARDPGMHYWGRLTPETLTISDYFVTGQEDDWGNVYERWDVKPETAVKEAEDFFRPAIMKSIMGIQSRKSGMDVGGMLGLTESDGSKQKNNLLNLLNHSDPEFQLQGLQLADFLYPELHDQLDSIPEVQRLSQPPSAESFMEIIKSRIQEFADVWIREKFKYVKDRQPDAAVQLKKVIADGSPMWTTARLDRWSSDYNNKTMMEILNSIDYNGDGHDVWVSSEAIDVAVDQFDKIDIDISFELELKWAFKIHDELYNYFKNHEEAVISEKAKQLSKLIRENT